MHQRPDYWEPLGALCAGDRAGGVQRGRGGGQLQPGPPRAQASARRLVPGMERGVCTLSHFTLYLFIVMVSVRGLVESLPPRETKS